MTVRSGWDAERGWLVTELRETVDRAAVEAWRAGLMETVDGIPDGTSFKLLLDLSGYEPASRLRRGPVQLGRLRPERVRPRPEPAWGYLPGVR